VRRAKSQIAAVARATDTAPVARTAAEDAAGRLGGSLALPEGAGRADRATAVDGAGGSGSGSRHGGGAGAGADQRASCLYCPEPYYPLIARARGWEGSVEIALSVLTDGSVDGARLRRSSGYPVLDEAAIAVARQSRFRLPRDNTVPTPLRGRIEYRFVLRSR
jgi:TonB family protein